MGVSRSRDDYRLGKPIIHAAISPPAPFPSLLYGCSGSFHYFFPSLLPFHADPYFCPPSLSPSYPVASPPRGRSKEGRYLHFLRGEPCLPFGYAVEKKTFRTGILDHGGLYPRDRYDRAQHPSVITFVTLMLSGSPTEGIAPIPRGISARSI